MDEIIGKFLKSNIDDLMLFSYLISDRDILIIELDYIKRLSIIFSMSEEELINVVKNTIKINNTELNVFIFQHIIEELSDIEEVHGRTKEFNVMVSDIIESIGLLKHMNAHIQRYDKAAHFKKLETDMIKIWE